MRRLLLILLPLLLLALLYTPGREPDLHWLDGSWHDLEHETTRLVWTQTPDHGALGMLTQADFTTVLAIEPNGRLTVRELGRKLQDRRPPRRHLLLTQGPQELNYGHASLRYLNSRGDCGQLDLNLSGTTMHLRRD